MPRAGTTPQPAFEAQGYGTAQQANDLAGMFPFASDSSAPVEDYQPQTPEEKFLFGPSDRPNEPITHGAPFGAGSSHAPAAYESDDALISRVATQVASSPTANPDLKAFAARVAAGL